MLEWMAVAAVVFFILWIKELEKRQFYEDECKRMWKEEERRVLEEYERKGGKYND